ncbi:uncharacterized protein LOC131942522 [Physella acuta]|uniref:uncharacterized protein LOC131942522 n=1 Tax=Physella acuta TaxID=109671 RepID=UPI0027DAFC31|nr:uncharacterized protein LOC131942522 [Physella acuta]
MHTLWCMVLLCIVTESLQIRNLPALNEKEITRVYSGLFKTTREMFVMKQMETMVSSLQVSQAVAGVQDTQALAGVVYHGCCESVSSMVTYDQLPNALGQNVTLVSFPTRKQYFPRETCLSSANCYCGCSCSLVTQTFTALVYNPLYPQFSSEPVILTFVLAPSFCRCFNNAFFSSNQLSDI